MKFTDAKDMTVAELNKKLKSIKADMFEAKMKNTLGQLSNPIEIRQMRKSVARIKTALSAKAKK
ncbi:MAG: 50S ribosomal protein L29 [Oligoflexia bacterium]|nr:MAG: 50S ribosomal protein L29 [Oligoflexia bacterium]